MKEIQHKLISIALIISIIINISLVYLLFSQNNSNNEPPINESAIQYREYFDGKYSFKYPEVWNIDINKNSTENNHDASIIINSDDFEIFVSINKNLKEVIDNCDVTQDCGGVVTRIPYEYLPADFNIFTTKDNVPLLIAKSNNLKVNNITYLNQEYDGGITELLTILGFDGEYDQLIIGYKFKTENSLAEYDKNMGILKVFVESLDVNIDNL
jgi:hypothetical protein